MPNYICITCGTQFKESVEPPLHCPICEDERWVMRPDPVTEFWNEETHRLNQEVSLYRCGGHYTGSTVLHWSEGGAEGLGVLLSSDTMFVARDLRHVSFMRSYPNYIPLSGSVVDSIIGTVAPLEFDRIYGHFSGQIISTDAKTAVQRSAERYKKAIGS